MRSNIPHCSQVIFSIIRVSGAQDRDALDEPPESTVACRTVVVPASASSLILYSPFMTSTNYYPRICVGLFDSKQKQTSLDRVVLLQTAHEAPLALGLHKGTAGFTAASITKSNSLVKLRPSGLESGRRYALASPTIIVLLGVPKQAKKSSGEKQEEIPYVVDYTSGQFRPVFGVSGRLQDVVSLVDGVVIVGDSEYFWLPREGALIFHFLALFELRFHLRRSAQFSVAFWRSPA